MCGWSLYSTIDEDKAYGQQSFRESSLLQGTFDLLLGISSKQSLLYGLEYEIKFIFEVQENEKSENVSIFLKVRILLFLYLVQYYLYIQYRKACSQCVFPGFLVCCMILNRYGQCRTTVFVKQSTLFSRALEFFYHWSTKQLHLILEEHFLPDPNQKSMHGMITLLSYNLQVIESKLTFKPVISAYAFPLSVIFSILFWWFIFILWFMIIAIYRINGTWN